MRINDTFQPKINLQNRVSSQRFARKGQAPTAADTAGNGKQSDQPVRPMRTYKGHGMLEQYPANLTLAYVSSHENRHANKNRGEAGIEGGNIRQDISYKVRISPDGKLMATGGVTKSYPSARGNLSEKNADSMKTVSSKSINQPLSPETFEKRIKEFHLARKRESLEKELRNKKDNAIEGNRSNYSEFSEKANYPLSVLSENNSNSLRENIERIQIRQNISQVENEKEQIFRSEEPGKSLENETPEREVGNPISPELSTAAPPKEEHVDLSRVAPASYYFAKRAIPNTVLTNGFGSAFEMNNILNLAERFQPDRAFPKNINFQRKAIKQQGGALDTIATGLNNIKIVSQELSSIRSFNVRTAKSSFKEAVAAETSAGSPIGKFRVSVNAKALSHKIVSNEYSDPFTALGLSGSFKINGYQVDVDTTDSLNSIKDKINYGEDVNKNGKLDFDEDINGNGSVDSFQYNPTIMDDSGTYIFEDVDFDGELDPSEDVDGDELMDGGTAQLGVRAEIQSNRLMINAVKTGNQRVIVDDTDDILLGLGVLFKNTAGKIGEKYHFDSNNDQLNSTPSMAQFSINNLNFERPSNEVRDVIPNTNLQLKQVTGEAVTLRVKNDIESTQTKIENFAENYNSSLSKLNDFLAFQKTLQTNAIVQNLRAQLIDRVNSPVESLSEEKNSLQSVGLELKNTEKHSISAFALRNVANSVFNNKRAVSSYKAQGDGAIYSELKKSGIASINDDTHEVDDSKLSTVLSNSPLDAARVFAEKDEGVSGRLESFFDVVLGKQGTLDLEKQRLNAVASSLAKVSKAVQKSGNLKPATTISAFA